ncbi:hypothetical protein C8J57DRAFT_1438866 [Mycena rebaudengoi]|nr:hypothetical protein C8J57DRAFT_1438866 [Mycena rebaudengoi]
MRRERIRLTPAWRKHGPRRDCMFAVEDQHKRGFRGMSVKVGRSPDTETGMWMVELEYRGQTRLTTVVHLDSLLRGEHLIPVFGARHIPVGFHHSHSLDAFTAFHVNKYIDHHANEIAF